MNLFFDLQTSGDHLRRLVEGGQRHRREHGAGGDQSEELGHFKLPWDRSGDDLGGLVEGGVGGGGEHGQRGDEGEKLGHLLLHLFGPEHRVPMR